MMPDTAVRLLEDGPGGAQSRSEREGSPCRQARVAGGWWEGVRDDGRVKGASALML